MLLEELSEIKVMRVAGVVKLKWKKSLDMDGMHSRRKQTETFLIP